MRKLYGSAWGQALLSALMAGAALAVCARFTTIAYLTNDDNAIAFALAGYQTGTPYPYALFINCLLGYAVSGLYALLPSVPWWAALQLGMLFLSMTAVGACLLRVFQRRGQGLVLPLLLYGALILLLFLQPMAELTYTVTAAAIGAAGCALIITAAGETGKKRAVLDALGGLAVLLAFLMREETGFAVLCYFALACAYRLLAGVDKKRAAALFLSVIVLCGGAFLFNNAMQKRVNGADFMTYFHYRERFTDYPRDTYEENPALYESVGWDEPLYRMADQWCFLDERVNADALKTITEQSSQVEKTTLTGAAKQGLAMLEEPPGKFMAAGALTLLCMGLYAFLRNGRRGGLALLAALCALGGCCALCLYLGLTGRFLYRTFLVAAIPAVICAAVLVGSAPPADRKFDRTVTAVMAACLLALALLAGGMQMKTLRGNSPREQLRETKAVNAYALAHPDNAYLKDALSVNDYDAFATYPGQKPVNLLSWGGCGMRSEAYKRQLAVNGIQSPYADMLRQENVYVILPCGETEQTKEYEALLAYLRSSQGAKDLALVEQICDRFAVYKAVY